MKRILLFLFAGTLSVLLNAQAPQAFRYQMVVRDNTGALLKDTQVSIKISIFQGSSTGTLVYAETQSASTNAFGLLSLTIGQGTLLTDSLKNINWSAGPYFLNTQVDPAGGTAFVDMGTTQLLSVPYALYAGKVNNKATFEVVGNPALAPDSALFEVKDRNGLTVFAVYEDGAVLYVKPGVKGGQAGFAVGGRTGVKGTTIQDILRVTPDSVSITINDQLQTGKGFSVKGQTATGAVTGNEYFSVSPTQTRVTVNEPVKGGQAGFAVGGRTPVKGTEDQFFNVSSSATADIINPSQPRILWYPKKEALLTGRVLIESPDSIGLNSFASGFESKSIGNYSQALGYHTIARGTNSTAIGYQALAADSNSFAFGDHPVASNINSFAFGNGAVASGQGSYSFGFNTHAVGYGSFAMGGPSGITNTEAIGTSSFAFGLGAKALNYADVAIGVLDTASGGSSTALGYQNVASGSSSVAMGYQAKATAGMAVSMGYQTEANGSFSLANGVMCKANGYAASALGYMSQANDYYCTAIGFNTMASGGEAAFASGYETQALNNGAVSLGWFSKANGNYAMAAGFATVSSGMASLAFGMQTQASGMGATALGRFSNAAADNSTALGYSTYAKSFSSLIIGQYNDTLNVNSAISWNPADVAFAIGNGSSGTRSNALTVLKSGMIGIQSVTQPTYALQLPNSSIIGEGQAQAYAWVTYSDTRVKTSQQGIHYGLADVMKLTPKEYIQHSSTFTGNQLQLGEGIKTIGLIAQEVYNIIPEAVSNPGDQSHLWGIDYNKLVPVLVKAIQEQQKEIESVKSENEQLKAQNENLQSQLQKISALESQLNELKEVMGRTASNK